MIGLLLPSLLAVLLALAVGGSGRNWATTSMRGWPLVVGAFACELVLYNPPVDREPWAMSIGPWLWLASRLLLLGVMLANAAHPMPGRLAWWLAIGGMACNTLVIAANGGHMPQSTAAAAAVWGASLADPSNVLDNVAPMTPDTRLAWLGDVLPEPRWLPRPNVVSIGDVLLAVGAAGWLFRRIKPADGRLWGDIVTRIATPIHGAARLTRRSSI